MTSLFCTPTQDYYSSHIRLIDSFFALCGVIEKKKSNLRNFVIVQYEKKNSCQKSACWCKLEERHDYHYTLMNLCKYF